MILKILVGIVVLTANCSAFASPIILDQEFPSFSSAGYSLDYPGDAMAQTFTVGTSGRLHSIGIRVEVSGIAYRTPPVDDLHVSLLETDESGAPDFSRVLAARDYSWSEVPNYPWFDVDYLNFDLSTQNIRVSSGDRLAIALSSDQAAYLPSGKTLLNNSSNYSWATTFGDAYPGGDFYVYSPILFGSNPYKFIDRWRNPLSPYYPESTRDMGFKVLIAVPEPPSIVPFATILLAMLWQRCRGTLLRLTAYS